MDFLTLSSLYSEGMPGRELGVPIGAERVVSVRTWKIEVKVWITWERVIVAIMDLLALFGEFNALFNCSDDFLGFVGYRLAVLAGTLPVLGWLLLNCDGAGLESKGIFRCWLGDGGCKCQGGIKSCGEDLELHVESWNWVGLVVFELVLV
jgi:hypothetical protein